MNNSTTEHSPLFSILIANFNNGQYLQECIDSVLAQTYTNWEVIIVDDCSTDSISFDIYKKYENDSRLKIYLNEENKGCGYTKRRCAEEAKGEICAFLDPDDAITPNALEIMVEKHIQLPNYSLIYSTHYLCDEKLNINKLSSYPGVIDPDKGYFCGQGKSVSAFATFKTKLYNKTMGINPKLKRAVDQDLYYKLEETGNFQFIDTPLYFYRIHNNGISTGNNYLKAHYWHLLVKTDTYKRRRDNKYSHNISKKLLNKEWHAYFISKAIELKLRQKYYKMFILILKSLKYSDLRFVRLKSSLAILKYNHVK